MGAKVVSCSREKLHWPETGFWILFKPFIHSLHHTSPAESASLRVKVQSPCLLLRTPSSLSRSETDWRMLYIQLVLAVQAHSHFRGFRHLNLTLVIFCWQSLTWPVFKRISLFFSTYRIYYLFTFGMFSSRIHAPKKVVPCLSVHYNNSNA